MNRQKKQIIIGTSLILFFFLSLASLALTAYLPGFLGEFAQLCLSFVTSPFLMETTIFFLAITLLLAINGWVRTREGDDYFTLDKDGIPIKNTKDKK